MRISSSAVPVGRLKSSLRARLPSSARSVLLLDPSASSVPPLDLLRLSTGLQASGFDVKLQRGPLCNEEQEAAAAAAAAAAPDVAIVTGVFSWDLPAVRTQLAWMKEHWSESERFLTGVLARREGRALAEELDVRLLATGSMEARLDELKPDYSLVPDWSTSILITSKFEYRPGAGLSICPRACDHCKMPKGAETLPPIRLVSSFEQHLEPRHTSVAIWDNTLMSTPRDHFVRVASALADFGRPVDISCGLMPAGVDEDELQWRVATLAQHGVVLSLARMECNDTAELDRFLRMLAHVHDHPNLLADGAMVQCFAVVNALEPPSAAWERLEVLESFGVQVEVVYFTPHSWFHARPFVNTAHAWTARELRRFHSRWGGFLQNPELATDEADLDAAMSMMEPEAMRELERSMADFSQQN